MSALPAPLDHWFAARGWRLHPHQAEMLARAEDPATLLIAPTGGGKTLAGFLPTLTDLAQADHAGLHTLYISPLKALAADIRRNLTRPVAEMSLAIRIEDRTGDTSSHAKRRQRADPPHILLTTPESLALLTSYEDAPRIFAGLKRVVVDEVHSLAESKRGDQLMLALSRLHALCPGMRRVGLSATVEDPPALARFMAHRDHPCDILRADPGPDPDIAMLETAEAPPWSGGGAAYAIPAVLDQLRRHKTTLIFHNTRAQAEIFFRNLWLANEDALPIGIHHGSLDRVQRERVEGAMVRGELRAVVCTGSLDLGLDWGDVDLVIQVGAPKNVKRLVQRIGRANHRYNAPSKALLVPANRFEVVECLAALQAVKDRDLDGAPRGDGPRDVLCQHILIRACAGPFNADDLYTEVASAGAYATLTRAQFDACLEFCATGGYALRAYDQWQRLKQRPDDLWQLRDPRSRRLIRMNIGTIQDTDTLKVRMRRARGGKPLGEIEEGFAATLSPGDTFLIGGQIVRFESLREMVVEVSRDPGRTPKIATFTGTKFATSTQLSERILAILNQPDWPDLPTHIRDWLNLQRSLSEMPQAGRLLIESFPHEGREHVCIYGFAGRNAMQTLGLLVTRRMEAEGLAPLGFVSTDYATLIWGLEPLTDAGPIFARDTLHDGLESWLMGNAVMKRTFRASATIAGLIQRNSPQARKNGRQTTISSDILYDTLVKYDPGHLLLDITQAEAMRGLVDFGRIEEMLNRINGRITLRRLKRVSPLAAPLFLEAGRTPINGAAQERLLAKESAPDAGGGTGIGRPGAMTGLAIPRRPRHQCGMDGYSFTLAGAGLTALPSGALYWEACNLLCVSDLHFGKSERRARLGEPPLPPYETRDTLTRLEEDLRRTGAATVICLGDSFDDSAAAHALPDAEKLWIAKLQAGRRWVWIEGNHDPGPVDLGGAHMAELPNPPLVFRHIARAGQSGEVSGHYHPKARLALRGRSLSRPAFLIDSDRVILPAYGTYTGGLWSDDAAFAGLMRHEAIALLTGPMLHAVPMPRA